MIGGDHLRVIVKRNTGVIGGIAKVSLYVDEKEKLKLFNGEEQLIVTDKDKIVLQVKQLLMSSRRIEIEQDEVVEIKLNQIYVTLWWIALICLFVNLFIYDKIFKFIFAAVALLILIFVMVAGSDNYFILKRKKGFNDFKS